MNIPKSAIRPFEPHGIPRLCLIKYATITDALDEAFKIMNLSGEDDDTRLSTYTIRLFLFGCVMDGGGSSIEIDIMSVRSMPRGRSALAIVSYTTPNKKVHRYTGAIRSNAGFDGPFSPS